LMTFCIFVIDCENTFSKMKCVNLFFEMSILEVC
jgi:hypothetical protein